MLHMNVSYACSCLFSTASAWRISKTLKKISNKLWKKLADKYEETIEDEVCVATETTNSSCLLVTIYLYQRSIEFLASLV